MSEEILRIQIAELATVRVRKQHEETTCEMPIGQLEHWAFRRWEEGELPRGDCEALKALAEAIERLAKTSDVAVEFTIPVKPRVQ